MATVIMTLAPKDIPIALLNIPLIQRFIQPTSIIVIGGDVVAEKIAHFSTQIEFIHEDKLIEHLNLNAIKSYFSTKIGSSQRAGWYFQQFLKMGYAKVCDTSHYIIWDADTFPLRPLSLIDSETAKPFFTMKDEMNIPYFKTLHRLFPSTVSNKIPQSFIAEHMLITRSIMLNMIDQIETSPTLNGSSFWERILNAIDIEDLPNSGFSEFETYGHFTMHTYPDAYVFRNFKTYRQAKKVIGIPNYLQMEWMGRSYDTVSIESWERIGFGALLSRRKILRHLITFQQLVNFMDSPIGLFIDRVYYKLTRILRKTGD